MHLYLGTSHFLPGTHQVVFLSPMSKNPELHLYVTEGGLYFRTAMKPFSISGSLLPQTATKLI